MPCRETVVMTALELNLLLKMNRKIGRWQETAHQKKKLESGKTYSITERIETLRKEILKTTKELKTHERFNTDMKTERRP